MHRTQKEPEWHDTKYAAQNSQADLRAGRHNTAEMMIMTQFAAKHNSGSVEFTCFSVCS